MLHLFIQPDILAGETLLQAIETLEETQALPLSALMRRVDYDIIPESFRPRVVSANRRLFEAAKSCTALPYIPQEEETRNLLRGFEYFLEEVRLSSSSEEDYAAIGCRIQSLKRLSLDVLSALVEGALTFDALHFKCSVEGGDTAKMWGLLEELNELLGELHRVPVEVFLTVADEVERFNSLLKSRWLEAEPLLSTVRNLLDKIQLLALKVETRGTPEGLPFRELIEELLWRSCSVRAK